jgi:NADH-quinone oxidoreductase subunit J
MDPAVLCYIGPIVAVLGLFFCFPDRPKSARWFGTVLAAAGVGLTAVALVRVFQWPVLPLAVISAGVAAVLLAGRMITHANPVYSALYFGGVVLCSAVLVLVPGAHFLAAILVIVYAGAVLVAYVFVIMLAQQAKPVEYDVTVRQPTVALIAGLGLIVAVLWALMQSPFGAARDLPSVTGRGTSTAGAAATANALNTSDNVVNLGSVLFGDYPVSIEVAGVFLLIAMIGAIVLASMRFGKQEQQS